MKYSSCDQVFYIVAMPRLDGRVPGLEKAFGSRIFYTRSEARIWIKLNNLGRYEGLRVYRYFGRPTMELSLLRAGKK